MNPSGRAGRILQWSAALLGGALALIALLIALWREAYPPLPPRLTIEVIFPPGLAGRGEPLITTGAGGVADFLAVRYLDETTAVVFYDVWGMGGPTSAPFALKPGTPRRLEIEMPTLAHVASHRSHEQRPLRVTLDGATLLDEPAYFHRRAPSEIFFAANPVGGTLVQAGFSGKITTAEGRALHGGPAALFDPGARVHWLLGARPWALLGCLALSLLGGALAWWKVTALRRMHGFLFAAAPATVFPSVAGGPPHWWFFGAATASLIIFAAVLTSGTFRVIAPDEFGGQYDFQARSLLAGRLDLPEAARTGESFIYEGRIYMYFGPTPALLRLPFAGLDSVFGQLTRALMLAYFAGWLVAAYLILIHVTRLARGPAAWPSAGATVLLTVAAGPGSTLLFLASRAYVYHEAILCGAAFALWSAYGTLRFLAEPARGGWIGALVCGVLAVHARPPAGLFALAALGFAAVALALRPAGRPSLRRLAAIGTLAALGFLSFNALSYLKFESFEGAPLRYHVQYDAARLAAIDGKNFHLANFRHDFDAYAWRPDFEFRPVFPYFYLQRGGAVAYPTARLDLAEPTLALPYAMPALCVLALGGLALAAAAWREARLPLAVLTAGTTPMALALFTAVAISHRYTGDFCAPLVALGAFGLVALDRLPAHVRRPARLALAALAGVGVLITLALALHYQGEGVWGVPDEFKARYQMLRQAVDSALGFSRP